MKMNQLRINRQRLMDRLSELSKIGRNPNGGIDRAFGSEADRAARAWLTELWQQALGEAAVPDAAANLWLLLKGSETLAPIIVGSHHDAVPNGGMYDGALGVLSATEVAQTLRENGCVTRHPLKLVSFTGEEPNPFGVSTLGSKVVSGRLTKSDLLSLRHRDTGETLQSALLQVGGNAEQAQNARLTKDSFFAFLELHVELGRQLEKLGCITSAVSTITGIYREQITVRGEANHAGTTVMGDRHDALSAAAELALGYETLLTRTNRDDTVGTIGQIAVSPNAANIIPGQAVLTLELRTSDEQAKGQILAGLETLVRQIKTKRGVTVQRAVQLDQPPIPMDLAVRQTVEQSLQAMGQPPLAVASMAGHDAANMQLIAPSGMVFVRSVGGKGHCPAEYSAPEEIETAANVLLQAVLRLDQLG